MNKILTNQPTPRHRLARITPEIANAWIQKTKMLNVTNRKVNEKWVERYAEDMKNGNWLLNGETITIASDGGILDGQHRLYACVKAGVPFVSSVVENIDRKTFSTIDCGRSRSASQVLAMEGTKYHKTITSIIRGVAAIRNKVYTNKRLVDMSNMEVQNAYHQNKKLYDQIAETIAVPVQNTRMLTPKLAGAVFFHLVHDLGYDWDTVESFILGAISEDSHNDPHVDALRKGLFRWKNTKLQERVKLANVARSWNDMVSGGKVRKFDDRIETIPDFVKA